MLFGFKMYAVLLLTLIGAQIVVAGETVVDFQRALSAYEKERTPSQTEPEEVKSEFKNPPIEVKVGDEEQEKQKE